MGGWIIVKVIAFECSGYKVACRNNKVVKDNHKLWYYKACIRCKCTEANDVDTVQGNCHRIIFVLLQRLDSKRKPEKKQKRWMRYDFLYEFRVIHF